MRAKQLSAYGAFDSTAAGLLDALAAFQIGKPLLPWSVPSVRFPIPQSATTGRRAIWPVNLGVIKTERTPSFGFMTAVAQTIPPGQRRSFALTSYAYGRGLGRGSYKSYGSKIVNRGPFPPLNMS